MTQPKPQPGRIEPTLEYVSQASIGPQFSYTKVACKFVHAGMIRKNDKMTFNDVNGLARTLSVESAEYENLPPGVEKLKSVVLVVFKQQAVLATLFVGAQLTPV